VQAANPKSIWIVWVTLLLFNQLIKDLAKYRAVLRKIGGFLNVAVSNEGQMHGVPHCIAGIGEVPVLLGQG